MGRAKAGICEWVLPERGPEALRHAAALGFDGIQIAEQGGWEAGDPLLRPEVQAAYFRARAATRASRSRRCIFGPCAGWRA
jgi:sugar phosphate isomerase/epimerase